MRSLVHCAGIGHDSGRCLFGAVPSAVNEWASFNATFTPSVDVITVYICNTGTASSVVTNLTVQQPIGTPQSHRSRSSMRLLHPTVAICRRRPARTPTAGGRVRMRVAAVAGIASASTTSADAARPHARWQPHGHAALLGTTAQGSASRQMLQRPRRPSPSPAFPFLHLPAPLPLPLRSRRSQ